MRTIPPSQLIVNGDGSAFHLHLLPEQVKENIILVGDPDRVDMVASFFDTVDYDVRSREFHAIGGRSRGKEIMCLSHGIGPDNIEIVLTELDALVNVDFSTRTVKPVHKTLNLVRIGTSGALQENLRIGDCVIAEKATGFDGILNFYRDRDKVCDLEFERQFKAHTGWDASWSSPYTVGADPELTERIDGGDMVRGFTIAAVGFYAPQGREVRLRLKDPGLVGKIETFRYEGRPVTNFEMESACLQGLARLLGHRAVTVCTIIAQRRSEDADTDYKRSVRKLIEKVIGRI